MFASRALAAIFAFALTAPRGNGRVGWRRSFDIGTTPPAVPKFSRTWAGALSQESRAARSRQKQRRRDRAEIARDRALQRDF